MQHHKRVYARLDAIVLLRSARIVSNATHHYGPGSAVHRFAKAARCAASGERVHAAEIFTGRLSSPRSVLL
jgi:hypothetical protein